MFNMSLPFVKLFLKELFLFLDVVLEVLELRNKNMSKAFNSMHSRFQTITPMALLAATWITCHNVFFIIWWISWHVQRYDFIDEGLIVAKTMMIVDISQVSLYVLQLVLEITNHMAILVGVKIVQASPNKRTQFFYIWDLMNKNHWGKEKHSK